MSIRIALVGDYNPTVTAHQAIPLALAYAGAALGITVEPQWTPTELLEDAKAFQDDGLLGGADGVWCVPASPYRSTEGALSAIRFAREHGKPFLGTCGGFQHAVLEYARNVLGWADAAHAELDPEAARLVITPLACALVETRGDVHFVPESRIAEAYGALHAEEGYHCRYGVEDGIYTALAEAGMRMTATDEVGNIRALELSAHPFFVATLFQPERGALRGAVPPLVRAFVAAAASL